jgi:hypothetical protein
VAVDSALPHHAPASSVKQIRLAQKEGVGTSKHQCRGRQGHVEALAEVRWRAVGVDGAVSMLRLYAKLSGDAVPPLLD